MKIHPLTTGHVRLKRSFLLASNGWRRQLDLLLPDEWSEPMPIHCWAVEHEGRLLLVDTGEVADVHNVPFARFEVGPEHELPRALAAAGLAITDVEAVVLTHLHGDHVDGAVHVRGTIQVHDRELDFAHSLRARIGQRLLRQPLRSGLAFRPVALDAGPFGAFDQSRPLTDDGRVIAVATPGHTPGHISVVCVEDSGRHVLIAGDATDSLEQLRARRHDAIGPKPAVSVATIDVILAHAEQHRTVYLPSHDPDSVARLEAGTTL